MREEEAVAWAEEHYPHRIATLHRLHSLVEQEAGRQNLIAPSTIATMWSRHIVDSAQLLSFAPQLAEAWLDVGTGAGFPGLVVACLRQESAVLVEPRKRRAEFLRYAADALGLGNVRVEPRKVEQVSNAPVSIISARAVASLDALFRSSAHLCDESTTYILPKGASGGPEVEATRSTWHGVFHVKHSITDPSSVIVVANGVTLACTASR